MPASGSVCEFFMLAPNIIWRSCRCCVRAAWINSFLVRRKLVAANGVRVGPIACGVIIVLMGSRLDPASCSLNCAPGCTSIAAAHRWLTQQHTSKDARMMPYLICLLQSSHNFA